MVDQTVPPQSAAAQLGTLLDSPEVARLTAELESTRWTGRPGYPVRAMIGMALAKSLYAIPTWSRTARLVAEHTGLQAALGCVPSVYACYRFTAKLRVHDTLLSDCIASVVGKLAEAMPGMGDNLAIDGSDMPAYANGQRFASKGGRERDLDEYSDPDASWGHRSAVSTRKGGGYYGYKLHMAVCTTTGLPMAWAVQTASANETQFVPALLDAAQARGAKLETCALDKGYDAGPVYDACEARGGRPIIPLRQTHAVKRGGHKPPRCEHGEWRFAGSDSKRQASKWRCPTGKCKPASVWVKADRLHPLVPRETPRWSKLYKGRAAVEREFGRLKNDWALAPLRTRGLARVRLHADLTILAKLACALARDRAAHVLAEAA
jgi:hypothetical protein